LSPQLHEGSRRERAAIPDEPPLRAELFSISQLERHAAQLAATHTIGHDRGDDRLLTRLADNAAVLSDAYELVADAVTRGRQITPAAEWFIDNYHLIEEQVRIARRHLPRGYSRELPRLAGAASGTPRVYELALELISHSHGRVDLDVVRAFVASYQSVAPLRLGELWAIPIMLRLALIENLRRVVLGVAIGRRDRERAGVWAERLLEVSVTDPSRVVTVLAELVAAEPPLTSPFVSELASRLQGHGATSVFPMAWLEQRLAERGETVERAFHLASQSQAADSVAIANSIGSMRFLGATDWRDFVESLSVVDEALRRDPAGVYGAMDFATRDRYRHVVEQLARRSPLSELEVAERAVELAAAETSPRRRHVGYFLIDGGRRALERSARHRSHVRAVIRRVGRGARLPLYLGAIAGITGALVALLVPGAGTASLAPAVRIAWAIALGVCASQLASAVVHWAVTLLVPPRPLPRLHFSSGIPYEHRTLVAVPTMLTSTRTIDELVDELEVRFLANRDPNLGFALVSDFRDAPTEHLDDDAGLLAHATAAIEMLNLRYPEDAGGGGFFLLHRARRWNPREGCWMGWERKRGKLEELNELLRGDLTRFPTVVGSIEALRDIAYVIVLDSDTELPRDAARELAGTLAHPLNRAVFDPGLGRVGEGYAILQPRVGISLASASRSRFARLFAGECGIDPYTRAVSDVYQDVFGEGSFIGKGIYDVDAVRRALTGKLPENRILSHDLLEGAYGRAGLVSDVILFEDFPAAHAADASRRARWIRGDWQIARWLFGRVPSATTRWARNPISTLSQWKILDNLRRSLVPIALIALLVVGWLVPAVTWPSLAVVAATLVMPGLLAAMSALVRRPAEVTRRAHLREVAGHAGRELLRAGFTLACLLHDALLSLFAILRASVRVLVTRRKLLEWRTAADAHRAARMDLAGTYAAMWLVPLAAAATAVALVVLAGPPRFALAAPVLALWAVAPALVWWVSRPLPARETRLSSEDHRFLRGVARRTWRFFESHVVEDEHHLPPDNVQEHPPVGVAHRTSPTNIGMSLLANLAAYDLGYAAAGDVIARTARTFATLDRLPRYRGHFYNWYDTQTLAPLRPTYISTVDSGNLAGHLVILASGLAELAEHRVVRDEQLTGLADTLALVEAEGAAPATLAPMRALLAAPVTTLADVRDRLMRVRRASEVLVAGLAPAASEELAWWTRAFAAQVEGAVTELEHVAPWLALGAPPAAVDRELRDHLDRVPSLAETARLDATLAPLFARAESAAPGDAAAAWLSEARAAVALAADRATDRLVALRRLVVRAGELGDCDYDFLYDAGRHLLSIGFNDTDHRLDTSFYDLLASEARLASFVAIAEGKLPQEHWFHLGRLLTTTSGGETTLLSWSGSMFEYLMPLLVMPSYPDTLLDRSCKAAVARQIEYGRERGVPWGVSESGYHKTDAHLNYQYRAFGVPGLGFKRGLAEDLVIAPYASVMALVVAPEASCANLRRLASEGRLGGEGFYEAIDYTPSRLPPGKTSVTVRSYMAHHQGMSLLALTHLLAGRPMQRRFSADPSMRATDLLLQERVPRTTVVHPHPAEVSRLRTVAPDADDQIRVFATPNTPKPEIKLLSNGRYHVVVSNAGGGYSRWGELAVTRWHEDPTRDCWGTFCYLRDVTTGAFWSAAHQPTLRAATRYEAIFSQGRAEFRRRDEDIDTHVEIAVSSEDDVELRRITISNAGRTARTIELTSFAEIVLATAASDAAHRTFSNLFVQTELLPEQQAILATRRPRSAGEQPPWGVHLMTVHGATVRPTSYETDRAAFVGRGRSPVDPAAMHQPALGNGAGSVLDPIVAIRNTVELAPEESIQIHIVTGVAETRAGALALIEKYRDRHLAERVLELAWTQSQVVQRRLEATSADAELWERLAGSIVYQHPTLRAPATVIARNRLGQSGLWPYGISGDLPIVLVRISSADNVALARQLVRAHTYWRLKGLVVDLVIWNEDPSGYRQELHEQIMEMIVAVGDAALVDRPGGVFVRRTDQMSDVDSVLLQTVARAIIDDRAGTLAEQLGRRVRTELPTLTAAVVEPRGVVVPPVSPPIERADLTAFNGHGGFTADGREYVIVTTAASRTPVPWCNVLANAYFGTVVSESGGAYTWCENAHGYRLTPWHNDPVGDASGEAMFIRDDDDGSFWSPTPMPVAGAQPYTTRHGFGYSVFETTQAGITSELYTYVATDSPTKFLVLKLRNRSGRVRHLSISAFFELVLGSQRPVNMLHVVTEVDVKTGALFATNPYSGEFAPRVTFLECSEDVRSISGDRLEFLGRNGQLARPAAMRRDRLSGRVGAGLDPCVAMQTPIELADNQEREIVFTFGSGRDLSDARSVVQRSRSTGAARKALESVWSYWNHTLGAVNVQTPDPTLNFLANGWLVYQVLACRMWGRSGFYQSGGAFGFRDQLQDASALIYAEPGLVRQQLVRAASRQFTQGDVQHWWHPPLGRGVRTRISDDYLWLPYVACRYVAAVGDTGVLDETIEFIDGRAVNHDEDSYYDLPTRTLETASLYEHCVRAIRHGLRFGAHGLPLMGTGDWNDGMNLVGAEGRGESVWLGFFLYDVLIQFAELARRRGDAAFADECVARAGTLRLDLEQHAWDGEWYRRAYFDDGAPLGSATSPECQIDSLPQSWAILSKAGEAGRARRGLEALEARLVDRELGVIKLFDPPFDRSALDPGYVKGYVPGVRENGGQYTHAAIWAVMAFAAAGDTERAWELFDLINPVRHGRDADAIATYMVEPYVVAADVYTNPQHAGRGGWTWYTGSAGWMYRLVLESLLGLRLEVDRLRIEPRLPAGWDGFDLHYRHRDTVHHVRVTNLGGGGHRVVRVTLDGVEQPDLTVPLRDDRNEHWAVVEVGGDG
jgi:cyclic beta-1,2-glucan synthetase